MVTSTPRVSPLKLKELLGRTPHVVEFSTKGSHILRQTPLP